MTPDYSFVVPILDERESLGAFWDRLNAVLAALDGPSEVVFVDDGSSDGSYQILQTMHARDSRVKVVRLSRNFGHQVAITAGIDHTVGRAVVILDGDLQDPPEVAIELAKRWREGYDVVYAIRDERDGESWMKLKSANWFYRLMGRVGEVELPPNVGDFRLVDRRVVEAVKSMPEHRRYMRGMFAWVGYDQTGVHYSRDARYGGHTKYPFRKMVAFATDGIVSFSAAPLRLVLKLGFAVSALSFLVGIATIVLKIADIHVVPGWASITVALAFLSGVQLTVLGVMGEYIARIHDEVKRRPLYLVRDSDGFRPDDRVIIDLRERTSPRL